MTPQERQLVDDLFDRLAKLESTPRDPDAERQIAEAGERAPHALYALVQTALLQDEALKRANARIEDLQAQLGEGGPQRPEPRPTSFLDSLRDAFSPREPRGSVPTVRPSPSAYQAEAPNPPQASPTSPGAYPGVYPGGSAFGSGGSFLGSAASTAAGVIGGAMLLDGIRSMFGHHSGGAGASALGNFATDRTSPWAGNWAGSTAGSGADSGLARQAGINDIAHAANEPAIDRSSSSEAGDAFASADNSSANDAATDTGADNDYDGDYNDADDSDGADDNDFGDFGDDSGESYDV